VKKILVIDSIAELARFWDTHDIMDIEEDQAEVKQPVFVPGPDAVVRTARDTLHAVAESRARRAERTPVSESR